MGITVLSEDALSLDKTFEGFADSICKVASSICDLANPFLGISDLVEYLSGSSLEIVSITEECNALLQDIANQQRYNILLQNLIRRDQIVDPVLYETLRRQVNLHMNHVVISINAMAPQKGDPQSVFDKFKELLELAFATRALVATFNVRVIQYNDLHPNLPKLKLVDISFASRILQKF
jgi:hypothetical protein